MRILFCVVPVWFLSHWLSPKRVGHVDGCAQKTTPGCCFIERFNRGNLVPENNWTTIWKRKTLSFLHLTTYRHLRCVSCRWFRRCRALGAATVSPALPQTEAGTGWTAAASAWGAWAGSTDPWRTSPPIPSSCGSFLASRGTSSAHRSPLRKTWSPVATLGSDT